MGMNDTHTYYVRDHHSWGNAIYVDDWSTGRIHGWLARIPRIGDRIIFDMKSGRKQTTIVMGVATQPDDPPDMFFATVRKEEP